MGRAVWIGILVGISLGACSHAGNVPSATVTVSPTRTPTPVPVHRPPATPREESVPVERVVTLNEPVETEYIPGETRELYRFDSDRARRISIVMEATDRGGRLGLAARVFDADGAIIPRISASVGQPLLRDEWDLPGPGAYIVQVFGAETRPRAFTLTITGRPVPEVGGGTIAYGESHSGEIAFRGQRDRWVFQGGAGDEVVITMIAPAADAYLECYDPAGQLLGSSDDSIGQDPLLVLVLPASGTYTIVARMYGDDRVGGYRLALNRASD